MKSSDIEQIEEKPIIRYYQNKIGHLVKTLSSPEYNYMFSLGNGRLMRWGLTQDLDPEFCKYGPEILDIEVSTKCSKGCPWCFPEDTKISLINNKTKYINDIIIGDIIKSFDNNQIIENEVTETFKRPYKGELINLQLENDTILKLTPEHPVFIKNKGWIEAKNIKPNDEVICE